MATKILIFLDASAILAGIWSSKGGGRVLLRLGEAGAVSLFTGRAAIHELEAALRERAPEALGALALLLDRADVAVVAAIDPLLITTARSLLVGKADARTLAAAMENGVEYFVTLDQEHFLGKPELGERAGFPIGTPAECLPWLRRRLRRRAS